MSKLSVRVLDLVTFLFDLVTFLFDLVTSLFDLVTFSLDLVTFLFDLVTFFSPNRDDKFLCLVIIHKRDIDIFVKCTSDAATYTSVWQEYMALLKRNILRGMEVSAFICFNISSIIL